MYRNAPSIFKKVIVCPNRFKMCLELLKIFKMCLDFIKMCAKKFKMRQKGSKYAQKC